MKEELLKLSHWHMKSAGHGTLTDINLLLRAGECVSVSGSENSGRKLLAEMFDGKGVFVSGEAWVCGQKITDFHPQKLERSGVFYLGNDPAFMDCMDLAENFFLMRRSSHNKILLNNRAVHLRTAQVLRDFAMRYDVTSPTSRLHHLDRLLLSIVRAVDQGAQLIVLDDMTKGLNVPQIHSLLALLGLVKERGVALLIADNWSNWFEPLSDCILLCQDGCIERKIYDQTSPRSRALLQKWTQDAKPEAKTDTAKPKAETITITLEYAGVTMPLRFEAGTAVLLSSYDEQVLHGCWQSLTQEKSRCTLQIGEKTLPFRGLADLRRHRIAVWDGTAEPPALQENLTLQENILLPSMQRISRCGFFERAAKRAFSDREFWRSRLPGETEPDSVKTARVLADRWLFFHPRVLFIYNVFSSSDYTVRRILQQFVQDLCARGTTVVLLETADHSCRSFVNAEISL